RDQRRLFVGCQIERPQTGGEIGIGSTTSVIKLDHLCKARQTAIVHVGTRWVEIAQGGRAEGADISFSARHAVTAKICKPPGAVANAQIVKLPIRQEKRRLAPGIRWRLRKVMAIAALGSAVENAVSIALQRGENARIARSEKPLKATFGRNQGALIVGKGGGQSLGGRGTAKRKSKEVDVLGIAAQPRFGFLHRDAQLST